MCLIRSLIKFYLVCTPTRTILHSVDINSLKLESSTDEVFLVYVKSTLLLVQPLLCVTLYKFSDVWVGLKPASCMLFQSEKPEKLVIRCVWPYMHSILLPRQCILILNVPIKGCNFGKPSWGACHQHTLTNPTPLCDCA